jgi:hypothetical protein
LYPCKYGTDLFSRFFAALVVAIRELWDLRTGLERDKRPGQT